MQPPLQEGPARLIWAAALVAVAALLVLGAVSIGQPERVRQLPQQRGVHYRDQSLIPRQRAVSELPYVAGLLGRATFVLQQPLHTYVPVSRGANRDASAVPNARCVACHAKTLKGAITANGIRIDHATCAKNAQCTDCHSAVVHGASVKWVRSYDMDTCLECQSRRATSPAISVTKAVKRRTGSSSQASR